MITEDQTPTPIVSNYPRGRPPVELTRSVLRDLLNGRPDLWWWPAVFSIKACIFLARGTFGSDRGYLLVYAFCLLFSVMYSWTGLRALEFVHQWTWKKKLLIIFAIAVVNSLGLGYVSALLIRKNIERLLAKAGLDESILTIPAWKRDEALYECEKAQLAQSEPLTPARPS